MEALALILDAVLWPTIVLGLVFWLRSGIKDMIGRASKFRIEIPGGGSLEISASEAFHTLEALLEGLDDLIDEMDDFEKEIFGKISKYPSKPTVGNIFGEFERRNKLKEATTELQVLGRLRAMGLIRPAKGRRWDYDIQIEVTPFGRLVLRIREEQATSSHLICRSVITKGN